MEPKHGAFYIDGYEENLFNERGEENWRRLWDILYCTSIYDEHVQLEISQMHPHSLIFLMSQLHGIQIPLQFQCVYASLS